MEITIGKKSFAAWKTENNFVGTQTDC